MRKIQFADGEYYHLYNRGVERRILFTDRKDFQRFVYSLYYLNDRNFSPDHGNFASPTFVLEKGKHSSRAPLVSITAWCLMPNHFHLLVTPVLENGVSTFMQRIGVSYALYFNTKHERTGRLFENTFRAKHIAQEQYFTHASRYIHLNPVKLKEPHWKEKGIQNLVASQKFLSNYPWSSFRSYLGYPESPPVTETQFLLDILGGREAYQEFVFEWLTAGIPLPYQDVLQ